MQTEPIILAIETATSACSAALLVGDSLYGRFEQTQRAHTQLILPMIESLLHEAKVSRQALQMIAVGRGPGSFTGVRIAVSCAQGLGFGLNLPIYPISTLEALCFQLQQEIKEDNYVVVPALDARMQEIYASAFIVENQNISSLHPEAIYAPHTLLNEMQLPKKNIKAIGSGWDTYFQEIVSLDLNQEVQLMGKRHPDARHIVQLAKMRWEKGEHGVLAQDLLPVYLRDNVAEKSSTRVFS
ncbi:MAG: tRNA (adenosine(37)-N6)-threonylcarbamoyltransferase complex dimerization subunit type 1 TsaB [Gammaproteobacteria bacterium 39-13]|nr:tRNA (adenosine(37)-N6)-threonylcarbamoyltransferase complex dimerization subunit type 1 TsaB [Gammaproteobacteria bacterium]OJV85313.1 MAG: tRNA (adenosine(37)-N6)-threonylcarbamoyltransferase complex dimerization subunit type 1 TsaB [Gammaproteobacteria bacterium 39-13]